MKINTLPGVPLVESPFFNRHFNESVNSDILDIATKLNKDGYVIIPFPDKQFSKKAERIKTDLKESYDWDAYRENPKISLRVQDAWKTNEDVRSLAVNASILKLLKRLYGREPIPFQTLNFPVGTQQHFHSDAIHFSSIPERFMCGVWIALEDIDEESGPLEFYPGTHTWPIYTNEHIGRNHSPKEKASQVVFHQAWQALVTENKLEPQRFLAKKGDALIWSANLLHGGSPQLNFDKTRWSQVTHYYFKDCVYYTPMNSEPFRGIIDFREITDICTNTKVPNKCNSIEVDKSFIKHTKTGYNVKIIPSYDFDYEYYLKENSDVKESGTDPYEHYCVHGVFENRKARALSITKRIITEDLFDKKAYLEANLDVKSSGVDAYYHYIQHGLEENRPLKIN